MQQLNPWVRLFILLISAHAAGVSAQVHQDNSIFSEGPKRTVVIESNTPSWKFVSRGGSTAFVYFREHGGEDAFAVNVIDWDTFHMRTGWLFLSKSRATFESDEGADRSFDVPKTEVKKLKAQKNYSGQHWLLINVKGKEKRFLVNFSPVPASRTGVLGAHQKPVFELLEQLFADYDSVARVFQEQLTKVSAQPLLNIPGKTDRDSPAVSPSAPQIAPIEITSEPPGAEIYIDGVFSGSTPSKIALSPGEHTIRVTRPGFIDWERRVQVDAASTKAVNAILEKKP